LPAAVMIPLMMDMSGLFQSRRLPFQLPTVLEYPVVATSAKQSIKFRIFN
jgi:hypothetical protein